ncbi:MAG: hypothetical protein ABI790_12775, partial [Betaproteobacteria bacterium]
RPLDAPVRNYRETADFYPDECWFHKFRRDLVLEKERLSDCMDSMLPEFPATPLPRRCKSAQSQSSHYRFQDHARI